MEEEKEYKVRRGYHIYHRGQEYKTGQIVKLRPSKAEKHGVKLEPVQPQPIAKKAELAKKEESNK